MPLHLRSKLENLSTKELLALQEDTFVHLEPLPDSDPVRISAVGILDLILDVLAKRLDEQAIVAELDRIYAL